MIYANDCLLSTSLSANGSDLCTQISVDSACMLTMGKACTTNWVVIRSIFLISVTLGVKFIFQQYHRHFPSLSINGSVHKNRVRMSDLYFETLEPKNIRITHSPRIVHLHSMLPSHHILDQNGNGLSSISDYQVL